MPGGGELRISAALLEAHETADVELPSRGPHVFVCVQDDGVGMDAQTHARAFDAFFTTKEPGKGAGLGLSMVRDIVVAHGGRIDCVSEPGAGATFRILLPGSTHAGMRVPALTGPGAEAKRATAGARVMLVEDETLVRKSLARVLRGAGYRVVTAGDGLEAVELYKRGERPQLVLLDLQMPRMSGPDALAELRLIDAGVRVLFITGQPDETLERMARAYGVGVGLLRKPFSSDELLEAVVRSLQASQEIDDTIRSGER
jgi:CheY-like chemotaxis protein